MLVDFYMSGRLNLDEMISDRIALADLGNAFDRLQSGSVARSVVVFD
jgi:S-(hydroxymethyl)glutathione dehydrogenase/alcohol dehydrogenase